jgi:type IV secretion system protein VirB1
MTVSAAAVLTLAGQCAPNIAPQTIAAIIQTESHGNPLALNVNKSRQPASQLTTSNAVATAKRYVAAGYSVDLGLGQINSRNMGMLGMSWETIFDPCANISALGRLLTKNFEAVHNGKHPQTALRIAISMYNTGSQSRGFYNGYVGKVVANARPVTGAGSVNIGLVQTAARNLSEPSSIADENSSHPNPVVIEIVVPPAWNVFERAAYQRGKNVLDAVTGANSWEN